MKKIYLIMSGCADSNKNRTPLYIFDAIGWTCDEAEALKIVRNNECDIYEGVYDYVAVVGVFEGLAGKTDPPDELRWFCYQPQKGGYEEVPKPPIKPAIYDKTLFLSYGATVYYSLAAPFDRKTGVNLSKTETVSLRRIYTVTLMQRCEIGKGESPDLGIIDVVGWFSEKEDAVRALKSATPEIFGNKYRYAAIQSSEHGLYGGSTVKNVDTDAFSRSWFRFDRKQQCVFEMEKPFHDDIAYFSIG